MTRYLCALMLLLCCVVTGCNKDEPKAAPADAPEAPAAGGVQVD